MSSDGPEPTAELLKARAEGVVNYLALLQALARDRGMSPDDLVEWVQRPYADAGYYDEPGGPEEGDRLRQAVETFVRGRSLLYEASEVTRTDSGWEVRTPAWYVAAPPESFFFFDVDAEDFADYAHRLARSHAQRLGIRLEIELADGVEIARFREGRPPPVSPGRTPAEDDPPRSGLPLPGAGHVAQPSPDDAVPRPGRHIHDASVDLGHLEQSGPRDATAHGGHVRNPGGG
ncbi:hypothetical protein [Streptomyces sp. NPDC017435]|uniref:hypothetical protein n=1 Tax=Streptomyces sp. NPDC017435 TaxID=3364995 RepID=UPI00379708DA